MDAQSVMDLVAANGRLLISDFNTSYRDALLPTTTAKMAATEVTEAAQVGGKQTLKDDVEKVDEGVD